MYVIHQNDDRSISLMKKIISFILTFLIIFSLLFYNDHLTAEARGDVITLQASSLKNGSYSKYYNPENKLLDIEDYKKVILDMDDTLHISNNSLIDGNLEITGKRTLFVDGTLAVFGDVIINKDSGMAFNKAESGLSITTETSSNHRIYCYGNISIQNCTYSCICGEADFILEGGSIKAINTFCPVSVFGEIDIKSGTINATDIKGLFDCNGDINLINGQITASTGKVSINSKKNVNIKGGNIDITSSEGHVINSLGDVNISGGNIKLTSNIKSCIFSNKYFYFTGGYLEAVSLLNNGTESIGGISVYDTSYAPIEASTGISINDNYHIDIPENGQVLFSNSSNNYRIFDENGLWTGKIVLKEGKPVNSNNGSNNDSNNGSNNGSNIESNNNDSGVSTNNNTGNNTENNTSNGNTKYTNEWVNGKWYDASGHSKYDGILSWKCNSTGWWMEDSKGWYPISQWLKIDGKWYYFTDTGYMDYSEYRDGCWLGEDGAWDEKYSGGHWCSDNKGWWYEDSSGWYPVNTWLWIDGACYFFEADGYIAVNKYVDGYWVDSNGIWMN